jgi:hypothetical protein
MKMQKIIIQSILIYIYIYIKNIIIKKEEAKSCDSSKLMKL